jgi:hypothetical protein
MDLFTYNNMELSEAIQTRRLTTEEAIRVVKAAEKGQWQVGVERVEGDMVCIAIKVVAEAGTWSIVVEMPNAGACRIVVEVKTTDSSVVVDVDATETRRFAAEMTTVAANFPEEKDLSGQVCFALT